MSRINTNVPSIIAQRVLGMQNNRLNTALERLSTGLKVNRLAPDAVLRRMGLRPGDVITGFNEQKATNPADAKALLEELEASGEVQVTIQRQGKNQTIELKQ